MIITKYTFCAHANKQTKRPPSTNPATSPIQGNLATVSANNLCARGINFTSSNLSQLTDEYNWFVNNDKTPAVESFLKINAEPKAMESLFNNILKNESLSYNFIDSIVREPRKKDEYEEKLKEKTGNPDILLTFIPNNVYSKAFDSYMDKKVENARSIEALLKLRPDWKEEVLLEKFEHLRGNKDFQIGNIPKEFPGNSFGEVTNYLKNYLQSGYKNHTQIPEFNTHGQKYEFEFFTDGRTEKNVFGVYTQNKKFIFKIGQEKNRSLNDPYSLGTLALIDNYLTLNRCRNSAPICYYNHYCNTSIYKYIEHNTVNKRFSNPSEMNRQIPDFSNLGMYYNDTVGVNNYFRLEHNIKDEDTDMHDLDDGINNCELISVDNDHVTYQNRLLPIVSKYNQELPNAMQNAF